MSLFRGSSRQQQSAAELPQYTGIQLPASASALPIPISYGLNKLGVNIIYYANFSPIPILQAQQNSGKGGPSGSGLQIVGWFYVADLELALCEGPIVGVGQVFKGQDQFLFSPSSPNPMGLSLPYFAGSGYAGAPSLFLGGAAQNPWTQLGAGGQYPLATTALAYRGLAYFANASYNLGSGASLGSLQFEIAGRLYGSGANAIDADPALVVEDFLTNAQYGAGFPHDELDTGALLGGDGDSSVQTYCRALGLCFSPQIVQQEAANSVLTRWLQLMNCGAFYSGGRLKITPYGDCDVQGVDIDWTAPIAPVATLDDNAFLARENEDPVTMETADPYNLPTVIVLEALNRAGVNVASALVVRQVEAALASMEQLSGRGGGGSLPQPQGEPQYNPTPVYARDLAMAAKYGLRVGPSVTAHEICDLNVASIVAQLILQRVLYIRKKFYFSLDWRYCRLEPMDIVQITDAWLGLAAKTVRIVEVHENEDWTFDYVAEDFVQGVSTPGPNLTSGTSYKPTNSATPADPVSAVLIYEPPSPATNGNAEIWFGAVGGSGGVPDPDWGGANIWVSLDNISYAQIGTINGVMPSGVLTAAFANSSGFDITHTLSVDVGQSGAELDSTSDANAQLGAVNLVLLGSGSSGELVDFATATLTAADKYDLTRVQRGLFSTAPKAWPVGAPFAVLQNVLKLPLAPQYVGQTLYFKFQSFNVYGGGVQDISTCAVFTYPATGNGMQVSNPSLNATANTASVLVPITIPANSYILHVRVENLTAVAGATGYNVDPQYTTSGGAGPTTGTWGANTAANGAVHLQNFASLLWGSATGVVLTFTGGAPTSGSIKVTVSYISV